MLSENITTTNEVEITVPMASTTVHHCMRFSKSLPQQIEIQVNQVSLYSQVLGACCVRNSGRVG